MISKSLFYFQEFINFFVNKSGMNRIVPIPYHVKEELQKIGFEIYLFGDKLLTKYYFSTLWGDIKSKLTSLKSDKHSILFDTVVLLNSLDVEDHFKSFSKLWDIFIYMLV